MESIYMVGGSLLDGSGWSKCQVSLLAPGEEEEGKKEEVSLTLSNNETDREGKKS